MYWTGMTGYIDVALWFFELMALIVAIVPVAHNMMLVTSLSEDETNVWDFKKSFVKWSKIEVPAVSILLLCLLLHGSYILAAFHGIYVAWILYKYANGEITEVDPTKIMVPSFQDDVSSSLTYRLVYYIVVTFVLFFGLVYFTAQTFIRHPGSMGELNKLFHQLFPAFMSNQGYGDANNGYNRPRL